MCLLALVCVELCCFCPKMCDFLFVLCLCIVFVYSFMCVFMCSNSVRFVLSVASCWRGGLEAWSFVGALGIRCSHIQVGSRAPS